MAERKPRVNPLVPTHAIDRWLARYVHVGTPDEQVAGEVQREIDRQDDHRWTVAIARQTVRYALWRHHRNQAEYAWVMGPH